MLVENQVPLPEGVVLAAGASGDAERAGRRNWPPRSPRVPLLARPAVLRLVKVDPAGKPAVAPAVARRRRLSAADTLVDVGGRTRRRAPAGPAVLGRSLSPPCPAASRGRPGVLAGGADDRHRRRRCPGLCLDRFRAVRCLASFPGKTLTSHGETRLAQFDFGQTLSADEVAELAARIGELTKAGMPLGEGLRAVAGELPGRRLRRAVRRLADRFDAGDDMAAAMASQGGRIAAPLARLDAGRRPQRAARRGVGRVRRSGAEPRGTPPPRVAGPGLPAVPAGRAGRRWRWWPMCLSSISSRRYFWSSAWSCR